MADDTAKNELIEQKNNTSIEPYTQYPNWFYELGLDPTELLVLINVYSYSKNDKPYLESSSTLSKRLNIAVKTVRRILKHLVNKNMLIKIAGEKGKTNIYKINFDFICSISNTNKKVGQNDHTQNDHTQNDQGGWSNCPRGLVKMTTNNNKYNNKYNNSSSSKEEKNNNATTATKNDNEKEIQSVLDYYMDNINPSISPIEVEKLQEDIKDYSSKWVLEAIKRAVLQGKRKLGYIEGILNSWRVNGYDEIKAADQQKPPQDTQDTGEGKPHVKNSKEALIREYYENEGANKNGDTK